MKLQTKFTLSTILIVLIVVMMTFVVINKRTNSDFEQFIQEKIEEEAKKGPPRNDENRNQDDDKQITKDYNELKFAPDSPEARFLETTKNSLLIVGIAGILIAVIVSFLVSRLFLRRIYQLRDAMDKYKNKGESEKVAHGNIDEIDHLTEVYNLLIEKIAKQESIRKEYFIDTSHELKTPLTFIKSYSEGLIDQVFDKDKEAEIYKKILNESNRMIHLIKEMTILAKLESEEIALNKEDIDIKSLTADVTETLSKEIEKKGIKFEIDGKAKAEVDKDKFTQVFLNLIDNAIQYSQNKSTIAIQISKKTNGFSWIIKNKPQDKIDPKNLEFIFERFYRGDKSRSYDKKRQNLGIGLNIVKRIVELHGGKVEARLDENGFVVFEIVVF